MRNVIFNRNMERGNANKKKQFWNHKNFASTKSKYLMKLTLNTMFIFSRHCRAMTPAWGEGPHGDTSPPLVLPGGAQDQGGGDQNQHDHAGKHTLPETQETL